MQLQENPPRRLLPKMPSTLSRTGKNTAFKRYDQFSPNTGCFWIISRTLLLLLLEQKFREIARTYILFLEQEEFREIRL